MNEEPIQPAFRWVPCEDCDGTGEVGELRSQGYFQPPERDRCHSCDGSGRRQIPTSREPNAMCAGRTST